MCIVEQSKTSDQKWIMIKEKSLVLLILQSYADPDKKMILDAAEHPKTILDIIDECKLPQTSTYRKINSLIRNGLLIPDGQISMRHGKNVTTYVALFRNVEIKIVKNDVQARAKIAEASKNAVLQMTRKKIINSKKFNVDVGKDLSQAIHQSLQKSGSKSVVPYLLKERIIKV
jgi:predicted transcriptional regulator